jgi:DNA-binding HxlR family transcriptional regulator
MPDQPIDPLQEMETQRVVVLQVLRQDHPQPWTRPEIESVLHDIDPDAIALALQRLAEHGVVNVESEQITPSTCARHLDALDFICI